MNQYLNLFKSMPVNQRTSVFSFDYIEHGVLVEGSVANTYSKGEIEKCVKTLVPTTFQMNQTFHKSWKKVKDAPIERLVAEQLTHYFTTYGLENIRLYNEDIVYIPNERLNLEESGGITLYVLHGITEEEVVERVKSIISSGIALSESDLDDLAFVIKDQGISIDPSMSSNKEMRVRLYDMLGLTPKDPVEYLRLQVFRVTKKSLLIKNQDTIQAISDNTSTNVFTDYEKEYGLSGLATVFYRFKPLFLAFKNNNSASTVNHIRRLAKKHHRPLPEDYLGSVTKHLRDGTLDMDKLGVSLQSANVFRKIKLIQALRFYNNEDANGVVYSVRNGKDYATTINPLGVSADDAIKKAMVSLSNDLGHLKGKRIYMDTDLMAPSSGKMFCGAIPFGSYFGTGGSLVLGVSWKDVDHHSIDLDLSLANVSGKVGWDGAYRNQDVLFSGDITAAPNGATEAHLIKASARDGLYLLNLNYYNAWDETSVPFTLFVAKEDEFNRMNKDSMVSRDNMLFWADSVIDSKNKQKIIGVLKIRDGIKTFHVFEAKTSNSITFKNNEKSERTIDYYDKYLDSMLSMLEIFEWSGAELASSPGDADVDLSLSSLTRDTLIGLLTNER